KTIAFLLNEGAGGTGTVTIKVEACTSSAGANNTSIAFRYATGVAATGVWSAFASATAASGYTTVAGANKMVLVEVDAMDVYTAISGSQPLWVRLALTEVVNSPCAAGITAFLGQPVYSTAAAAL